MASVYDYYYENYLMLYSLYGRGRPRVSRERYEELDREMLSLVSQVDEHNQELSLAAVNRIRDVEYILLDDVAEALLDRTPGKKRRPRKEEESARLQPTDAMDHTELVRGSNREAGSDGDAPATDGPKDAPKDAPSGPSDTDDVQELHSNRSLPGQGPDGWQGGDAAGDAGGSDGGGE